MGTWAKVVGLPLGLVAFSLYLVYKFATSRKQSNFVRICFLAMAIIAMLGGLGLGYLQFGKLQPIRSDQVRPPTSSQQQTNQVHQSTSGSGSPAIQGVQGDVRVTVGGGPGEPEKQKTQEKKQPQKQVE